MKIAEATFLQYHKSLVEQYRPPSRGGNTKAWHQHTLIIDGERYSFLALGTRQWVYATDSVSFEWSWDETKQYRNVNRDTLRAWDKDGMPVVRGERGTKPWRTAAARLPASRREQRD